MTWMRCLSPPDSGSLGWCFPPVLGVTTPPLVMTLVPPKPKSCRMGEIHSTAAIWCFHSVPHLLVIFSRNRCQSHSHPCHTQLGHQLLSIFNLYDPRTWCAVFCCPRQECIAWLSRMCSSGSAYGRVKRKAMTNILKQPDVSSLCKFVSYQPVLFHFSFRRATSRNEVQCFLCFERLLFWVSYFLFTGPK